MKTFVTIIIILLLLRWMLKPFIKFTVSSTINKMANEAMKHQQYNQRSQRSEGTISVDYVPEKGTPPSKKFNKPNTGDFVDYEEVK